MHLSSSFQLGALDGASSSYLASRWSDDYPDGGDLSREGEGEEKSS